MRRKEFIEQLYKSFELFPEEYLVVHQTADEATKEKIKAEAQARRKRKAEKRLERYVLGGVSGKADRGPRYQAMRDTYARVQAGELSNAGAQSETPAYQESEAT